MLSGGADGRGESGVAEKGDESPEYPRGFYLRVSLWRSGRRLFGEARRRGLFSDHVSG